MKINDKILYYKKLKNYQNKFVNLIAKLNI